MNSLSESDAKSNRSGSKKQSHQPTQPFQNVRPSSRSGSAYFYSSSPATTHDAFNADKDGSSILTSPYNHDPGSRDVRHDEDVSMSSRGPNVATNPYHSREYYTPLGETRLLQNDHPFQQQYQQHQRLHDHELHQNPRLYYHSSTQKEEPNDDDDDDDDDENDDDYDDDTGQGFGDVLDEASGERRHLELPSSLPARRLSRPISSHEIQLSNFITEQEFLMLADDYLMSLSPKKREKALLSNSMYQKILLVLLQPKNTQVSTAQFRFWAKKMFTLSTTETHHVVCHAGKPVATKECLYDVLVYCHRKSSHGGRDKTSAEVRQHYSWVPKELIARFVKHCPLCSSRRYSLQRPLSSTGLSTLGHEASSSLTGFGSRTDLLRIVDNEASFHSRRSPESRYLGQSSSDQIEHGRHTEHLPLQSHPLMSQYQQHWSGSEMFLQQQHRARIHSEHIYHLQQQQNQQQQRTQEGSLGRPHADTQYPHNHQYYLPNQMQINAPAQVISRTRQTSGFRQPTMTESGQGMSAMEVYSTDGWSDAVGGHDSQLREEDGEFRRDPHHKSDRNTDLIRYHGGDRSGQTHPRNTSNIYERVYEPDVDCTPSGLVGVPQVVRSFDRPDLVFQGHQVPRSQSQQQVPCSQTQPPYHAYELFRRLPAPPDLAIQEFSGLGYQQRHPSHNSQLLGHAGYPYGLTSPFSSFEATSSMAPEGDAQRSHQPGVANAPHPTPSISRRDPTYSAGTYQSSAENIYELG